MQTSPHDGCAHPDTAHAAVAPARGLLVARPLSPPPNAPAAALPTGDARPLALGKPQAGAWDQGACSAPTSAALAARAIEPSLAPGRPPHQPRWPAYVAQPPAPPPAAARPKVPRAEKLPTERGGALSRWRQWTVEPGLGLLPARVGWRPFSLRGLQAAAGAWGLGGRACHVKRLPRWTMGSGAPAA
jgi:hypothetical protein